MIELTEKNTAQMQKKEIIPEKKVTKMEKAKNTLDERIKNLDQKIFFFF